MATLCLMSINLLGWEWFGYRVIAVGVGSKAGYALFLMLVALGLFWWAVLATRKARPYAAFVADQPRFLCEAGPYRIVRHPFYMSYVLCWIGTSLATAGLRSWVMPAAMGVIYLGLALQEERKFCGSDLADAYSRYRSNTGMFLPRLRFARLKGLGRHA